MTLATSIRNSARNTITKLGNSASVYSYSSATKTPNDEGDVTVSNWGTAVSTKVVDGANIKETLVHGNMGIEVIGNDDKILRDDVTVSADDRITIDSVEYKVMSINPIRVQDTLIVQSIKISRMESTTSW